MSKLNIPTPDATTTATGKIELAGDLGNTATSPQVAKIQGTTVSGTTGTTNVVFSASPTIVTPTIASFTNANHNHSNSAGGGTIAHNVLTGLTSGDDHTQYIHGGGTRTGNQTNQLSATTGANAILRIGGDDTGNWALRNSMWVGPYAEIFQGVGDGNGEVNVINAFDGGLFSMTGSDIYTNTAALTPKISSVQTTDATVTTLTSISTSSEVYYRIRAMVIAKNTTGNTGGGYELHATFRNDSGTLTQIGSTTQTGVHENTAAWDATIDSSGTSIRVRVTGAASTTIRWHSYVEIFTSAG